MTDPTNQPAPPQPPPPDGEPPSTAPTTAPTDRRRRWIEGGLLVGAFILIAGLAFVAGRTMPTTSTVTPPRLQHQGARMPDAGRPGRGMMPGWPDGRDGWHRGGGYDGGLGRGGRRLPGADRFLGGLPGGGWPDDQKPGATASPEPGATTAPGPTPSPTPTT